jgi:hypothetical protein
MKASMCVLIIFVFNSGIALAQPTCLVAKPAKWKHYVGAKAEFDLPPGWRVFADTADGFVLAE